MQKDIRRLERGEWEEVEGDAEELLSYFEPFEWIGSRRADERRRGGYWFLILSHLIIFHLMMVSK